MIAVQTRLLPQVWPVGHPVSTPGVWHLNCCDRSRLQPATASANESSSVRRFMVSQKFQNATAPTAKVRVTPRSTLETVCSVLARLRSDCRSAPVSEVSVSAWLARLRALRKRPVAVAAEATPPPSEIQVSTWLEDLGGCGVGVGLRPSTKFPSLPGIASLGAVFPAPGCSSVATATTAAGGLGGGASSIATECGSSGAPLRAGPLSLLS